MTNSKPGGADEDVRVATMWFHVVRGPGGPFRAGPPYLNKETAKSWTRFVKAANRGMRTRVTRCQLVLVDGALDTESLQRLDQVFNLDPPDGPTMARLWDLAGRLEAE